MISAAYISPTENIYSLPLTLLLSPLYSLNQLFCTVYMVLLFYTISHLLIDLF